MSSLPLVLAGQGSFFVNARTVATAFPRADRTPRPGHISVEGMYVQFQVPADRNPGAWPVIMVHGACHTGMTWENTPDGRMGWAEHFVRRGVPVYVVDHAGRGRSGFDPSPTNRAKLEDAAALVPGYLRLTNEQAWTVFRIGPRSFVPHEGTRFPVEAADQYFAQIVPNTETSYPQGGRATVDALVALLDRVGPAVVLVHSQSGEYGIRAAVARPDLVKAVVSIEPRGCAPSDAEVQSVFTRVPLLTMFGDLFGTDVDDWPGRMAECRETVDRITAAGGAAENVCLPDRGIPGNSHMLMMDTNNRELADMVLDWLARNASVDRQATASPDAPPPT